MIDLHIHTCYSDGFLTPMEVIDAACRNGVRVIAIADHDTIDAYTDDVYAYAESKGVALVSAVEISTKYNGCGVHVLGYNFDIDAPELREKLKLLRSARHDYLHTVAKKLNELGYFLDVLKLDKIDSVTKAHIASEVIENPGNKLLLLENFGYIPKKGEFIETVMNEGCPAYVEKNTISPKEAALLVRNAGGKVVLAHPVAYQKEDGFSDNDIFDLVRYMKADGIEANYVYVERNGYKINDSWKWNAFAKKNNLFVTIGSDFHKDDGGHPVIGLVGEDIRLSDDEFDLLISNISD